MNVVHRQIIRTGHPATDQQALQQMQAQAASQGLELHVQPLPDGGFQVDVVSRAPHVQAPPPQAPYGQPPQNPYAQPGQLGQASAQGPAPGYGQNPYAQPPMAEPTQMPTPMAMAAPMQGQGYAQQPPHAQWQPQPQAGPGAQGPQGYGAPPQGAPGTAMAPFGGAKLAAAPARQMAQPGVCQACGRQAPTKQVTFHQNIGALIIRFPKRVSGQLCRTCISSYFWKYTTISFFFGWWGLISFFYTFVTIPMNIFTFLGALDLPKENPPGP